MSYTGRKPPSLATFGEVFATYGQGSCRYNYMTFAPESRTGDRTISGTTRSSSNTRRRDASLQRGNKGGNNNNYVQSNLDSARGSAAGTTSSATRGSSRSRQTAGQYGGSSSSTGRVRAKTMELQQQFAYNQQQQITSTPDTARRGQNLSTRKQSSGNANAYLEIAMKPSPQLSPSTIGNNSPPIGGVGSLYNTTEGGDDPMARQGVFHRHGGKYADEAGAHSGFHPPGPPTNRFTQQHISPTTASTPPATSRQYGNGGYGYQQQISTAEMRGGEADFLDAECVERTPNRLPPNSSPPTSSGSGCRAVGRRDLHPADCGSGSGRYEPCSARGGPKNKPIYSAAPKPSYSGGNNKSAHDGHGGKMLSTSETRTNYGAAPRTQPTAPPTLLTGGGGSLKPKKAAFLRLHEFLLKTHLASLFSALKADGFLSTLEAEKLSVLGARDDLLDCYFAFQKSLNLEAFVETCKAICLRQATGAAGGSCAVVHV